MAYVKHLGQFGQPRPSDLEGLSEALTRGMQVGAQVATAKTAQNKYKTELAKFKMAEDKMNKENAYKALEAVSLKMESMKHLVRVFSQQVNGIILH